MFNTIPYAVLEFRLICFYNDNNNNDGNNNYNNNSNVLLDCPATLNDFGDDRAIAGEMRKAVQIISYYNSTEYTAHKA